MLLISFSLPEARCFFNSFPHNCREKFQVAPIQILDCIPEISFEILVAHIEGIKIFLRKNIKPKELRWKAKRIERSAKANCPWKLHALLGARIAKQANMEFALSPCRNVS